MEYEPVSDDEVKVPPAVPGPSELVVNATAQLLPVTVPVSLTGVSPLPCPCATPEATPVPVLMTRLNVAPPFCPLPPVCVASPQNAYTVPLAVELAENDPAPPPGAVSVPDRTPPASVPVKLNPPPETESVPDDTSYVPVRLMAAAPDGLNVPVTLYVVADAMTNAVSVPAGVVRRDTPSTVRLIEPLTLPLAESPATMPENVVETVPLGPVVSELLHAAATRAKPATASTRMLR